MRLRFLPYVVCLLSCGFILTGFAGHAHAATFTVNVSNDNNGGCTVDDCSLREAITAANSAAGTDTINFSTTTFAAPGPHVIQLESALPNLSTNITILGPGANILTVRGEGAGFSNDFYRVFTISSGVSVSINGLTISDGKAAGADGTGGTASGIGGNAVPVTPPTNGAIGRGGAIFNSGSLTLNACVLSGNTAQGGSGGPGAGDTNQTGGTGAVGQGGAIYSSGPALSITRCTFSGNTAQGGSGGSGGSIQFAGGTSGPGGNAADGAGGAIYVAASGTYSISNSTFYGNFANGGSGGNGGSMNFSTGTMQPGGLGADGDGGAIYNAQSLTLNSCTVTACGANAGNGGLQGNFNPGTPGDAHGGGLYNAGSFLLRNTLVAGNTATNPGAGAALGPDVYGSFTSQNFNLIGIVDASPSGFTGSADQVGSPATPINALLDTVLKNNGGPTPTVALKRGSPALDKGDDANIIDQRGFTRPQDLNDTLYPDAAGGDASDIGAYEAILLSVSDASITEGNSGTSNLTFNITLSAPVPQTINLGYGTANGTAKAGSDFNNSFSDSDGGTPGMLTITAGQTSATITVPIIGDTINEATEVFYVLLNDSGAVVYGPGRGIGTITDTDAPPSITVDNVTVVEGNSGSRFATFTLHLSSPSGQIVRVTAQSANNTATAGSDYTALAPTQISFNVGASAAIARVPVLGDVLDEPNETFFLNLSSPVNATIADSQGIASISDDDARPSLAINDVSITEGNSGFKILTFTVTKTGQSANTITVGYASANGGAQAGSDYVAVSGTLSFPSGGPATQTISLSIFGDTVVEGNEVFYMFLSNETNAAIGRARGVGTITNDDASG